MFWLKDIELNKPNEQKRKNGIHYPALSEQISMLIPHYLLPLYGYSRKNKETIYEIKQEKFFTY